MYINKCINSLSQEINNKTIECNQLHVDRKSTMWTLLVKTNIFVNRSFCPSKQSKYFPNLEPSHTLLDSSLYLKLL